MQSATQTALATKQMLWVGRIMSAIPVLMLLSSGIMKLMKPAPFIEGFVRLGYPESIALGIVILELACAFVYLIPPPPFSAQSCLRAIWAAHNKTASVQRLTKNRSDFECSGFREVESLAMESHHDAPVFEGQEVERRRA